MTATSLMCPVNYSDNSIALLQLLREQDQQKVHVIYIDTGWAHHTWHERVAAGESFARQCGFTVWHLQPRYSFQQLVLEKKAFPTKKFKWCITFLKALPLLEWLDEHDSEIEMTVALAARRLDSRLRSAWQSIIPASEHYGGRRVWYPLLDSSQLQREQWLKTAGFQGLNHRALECSPCIHSTNTEINQLDNARQIALTELETVLQQRFIDQLTAVPSNYRMEDFDFGCGSHYGCGE